MNLKTNLCIALAALALAAPLAAQADYVPNADTQIALIVQNRQLWDSSDLTRQGLRVGFTVTDLDHDGRLEVIAAQKSDDGMADGGYVWEVTADIDDVERRPETWTRGERYGNFLSTEMPECYIGDGKYWYVYNLASRDDAGNVEAVAEYALALYDDLEWGKSVHAMPLGLMNYYTDDEGHPVTGYEDGDGAYMTPEQYYYERLGVKYFKGYQHARTNFRFYVYDQYDVQEWKALSDTELAQKLTEAFNVFSVEPD